MLAYSAQQAYSPNVPACLPRLHAGSHVSNTTSCSVWHQIFWQAGLICLSFWFHTSTQSQLTVEWKMEHTPWGYQHWVLDPLCVVATVLGSGPEAGMTINDSCQGSMVGSFMRPVYPEAVKRALCFPGVTHKPEPVRISGQGSRCLRTRISSIRNSFGKC